MNVFSDRRVVLVVSGGALALALVLVAGFLFGHRRVEHGLAEQGAPHAALTVRMGETGGGKLDPSARLRCFAAGRFVGELSVAECAARNGVDPGRMDVGVDSAGQVAAAEDGAAALAPLPEAQAAEPAEPAPAAAEAPAGTAEARAPFPAGADCLRYGASGWRGVAVGLSPRACARVLFEGRCVRPGEALYGRVGTRTLRLVPGRVEVSPDNRDFTPLIRQDAQACALDG